MLIGALLASGVSLIPAAYLVVRTAEAGWTRIVAEVWTERVGLMAVRSLGLTAAVWLGSLVLGVGAALLVARTEVPGRGLLGILLALPLAVPSYVAAYTWTSLADLWNPAGRFEGWWPAVLVLTLYSYPYVYLPALAAFSGQDPALEEAARALGRTEAQVLRQVTLRGATPAITSGGLLVALYSLSDFGAVSILRFDTFTRAVFTTFSVGFDRTGAVALASVLMVFALLIMGLEAAARRRSERYARVGGGSRRHPVRHRLDGWRWAGFAALSALVAAALGVPLASLGRWLTLGAAQPAAWAQVPEALASSLAAAALGAAATTALAIPLGLYANRVPGPFSRTLERIAYASHSLPGVVIGLSLVFFGIHVAYALYQSIWLLVLGYVTLFLPLAAAGVAGSAAQAPPSLDEVAQSLGLTPFEAVRRVVLPVMLPGIGAASALVFLTALKELPATLLLRPTGLETLATRLWTHTAVSAYPAAAPYAAILIAIAAVPTWLVTRRTLRTESP